jgi:hypothetical protein
MEHKRKIKGHTSHHFVQWVLVPEIEALKLFSFDMIALLYKLFSKEVKVTFWGLVILRPLFGFRLQLLEFSFSRVMEHSENIAN